MNTAHKGLTTACQKDIELKNPSEEMVMCREETATRSISQISTACASNVQLLDYGRP